MVIAECGFSRLAAVFASRPSCSIYWRVNNIENLNLDQLWNILNIIKVTNKVIQTFNRSWFLRLSKFCFMDRWEADCNANIHSHLSFSVLQAMCCWYWTCCLLIEDIGRWLFWFMHWWSLCSFLFRYGSFVLEFVDSKRWINCIMNGIENDESIFSNVYLDSSINTFIYQNFQRWWVFRRWPRAEMQGCPVPFRWCSFQQQ